MPIRKENFKKFYSEMISESEEGLMKHVQTFTEWLEGDDWSLVIKAHALIEMVITELVTLKLDSPQLQNIFRRLPLSDKQTGKVKFAKELDLISKETMTFIYKISELRNTLVHNYENMDFDFIKSYQSFNKSQRDSWNRALLIKREPPHQMDCVELALRFRINIWTSLMLIIQQSELKKVELNMTKKLDKEELDTLRMLADDIKESYNYLSLKDVAGLAKEVLTSDDETAS